MFAATAIAVANWLRSFSHITAAVPVVVQIGMRKYEGARITEDREGTSVDKLFLLGELPPLYRRSRHLSFRTAESDQEWCVTAWFRRIAASNAEYDEVFPFGSHIVVRLSSELETWAAEQCEAKRRRLKMTITEIGPTNANQPTEEKHDESS